MRIAVLGGIRANLPALAAVLDHVEAQRVHAIWNTGNFLGYGPFPAEVIDRLSERGVMSVLGSDELLLLKLHEMKEAAHRAVHHDFFPLRHAHACLDDARLRIVRSLPRQIEQVIEGRRVLVVHGESSLRLPHQTTEDHLCNLADEFHAQVVAHGHGARRSQRLDGVLFLNPGSVGQPQDGDPRAGYALLTITERTVRTRFFRVEYPADVTADAIRTSGLPEQFAVAVAAGRTPDMGPPDTVQEAPAEQDARIGAVLELARSCEYEAEHTHQVTRLALKLFDELAGLHGLGVEQRFFLHCAALLHDIGWIEGQQAHHKTALRIILNSPLLPFEERERLIIGSIARYHRKALPGPAHEHFTVLGEADQRLVTILAGILRVADGLDRTHRSLVDDFACQISPKKITLMCVAHWPAEMERQVALDKGQLLESTLGRHLVIEWRLA